MKAYNYKRLLLWVVALWILAMGAYIFFVWYKDPYQRYRARQLCLHSSPDQTAGLAATYDYNAALIGSSMVMNFFPAQIDTLFSKPGSPWKTVNLSILAMTHRDYALLIPFLIENGKMEHALMALDHFGFTGTSHRLQTSMVDHNPWNDYEYMFRISTLKDCFAEHDTHPDTICHFKWQMSRDRKIQVFNKTFTEYMRKPPEKRRVDYEHAPAKFDASVLSHVSGEGRDVDWYLFFPPYSDLHWVLMYREGEWENILALKRHMIEQLVDLPNVRLYDFQCEERYTLDSDKFMDLVHPNQEVCRQIAQEISTDSCRVTRHNYQVKLEKMDSIVRTLARTADY